jgi:hypothetical protein
MGVSRPEMLFKVILPASVPTIFVGIRIGASLTFFILIAAEMLGASSGLGWMVHNSAMNYLIPRIYASAFFIVVLGFLFNRFLLLIENSLFDRQESTSFSRDAGQAHAFVWRPGRSTLVLLRRYFCWYSSSALLKCASSTRRQRTETREAKATPCISAHLLIAVPEVCDDEALGQNRYNSALSRALGDTALVRSA